MNTLLITLCKNGQNRRNGTNPTTKKSIVCDEANASFVNRKPLALRSQILILLFALCLLFGGTMWGQTATKTYSGSAAYSATYPDIPIGATNISFSLSMGSCDYDLYVKEGGLVTTSNYTCRPYSGSGTTENCGPYAGPYNGSNLSFLINAYSGGCNWTLTITYTPPEYSAQFISVNYGSSAWCVGETRTVEVTVKNTGTKTWYANGLTCSCSQANCADDDGANHHQTTIAYKWSGNANFDVGGHGREPIGQDVAPGQTATIRLNVTPTVAGSSSLQFNFIKRECKWFNNSNVTPLYSTPAITITSTPPLISVNTSQVGCGGTQVKLTASDEVPSGGFFDGFENDDFNSIWATSEEDGFVWGRNSSRYNSGSYSAGTGNGNGSDRISILLLGYNLSGYTNIELKFNYYTPDWSGDYESIRVYAFDANLEILDYVGPFYSTSSWSTATVSGFPSGTAYVAFVAYDGYGYGAFIDNVSITWATSFTQPSFTWSAEPGSTTGTQNGATYTVTPAAATNTYTVRSGATSCTSSITIDRPGGSGYLSSSASPIDCGSPVTLNVTGEGSPTYTWYSNSGCTTVLQNGASYTPNVNTPSTIYGRASVSVDGIGPYSSSQVGNPYNFGYTGGIQTVVVPAEATVAKLQVWGAQGGQGWANGSYQSSGGKGGYSYVDVNVSPGQTLYVVVGGKGTDGTRSRTSNALTAAGGYNGGGGGTNDNDGTDSDAEASGGGGGATHIALSAGVLSSFAGNRSSVLVVAGGGGGGSYKQNGGYGGGTSGGQGANSGGVGGTQNPSTYFGQGQSGSGNGNDNGVAGGGGGWDGGRTNTDTNADKNSGGGGSGYITENRIEGNTQPGSNAFLSPSGSNETGHAGNGYARITFYKRAAGTCPSNVVSVSVNKPSVNITTGLANQAVCEGSAINLSTTATGNGTLSYAWQHGSTSVGTNSNTYTDASASTSDAGTYSVTVTSTVGTCTAKQNTSATVAVNTAPTAPTGISGSDAVCSGSYVDLSATGGNDGSDATYQWGTGTTVGNSIISGQTSSTIRVTPTGSGTTYWVRRVGNSACTGNTSGVTKAVAVNTAPTAPTGISGSDAVCSGSYVDLSATGGNDGSGATYQWGTGTTVGNSIISGQTSSTIRVTPTGSGTTYWVRRIGNSACTGNTSGVSKTVAVNTAPTAPTSISGSNICIGNNTELSVLGGSEGDGSTYQWGTGTTVGENTISGNTSTITVTPTETTTYWVRRVGNTACVNNTDGVTKQITVNTPNPSASGTYDYIWRGGSTDWNTAANWYMYSSGTYSVASSIPATAKNYFIGTGECLPSSQWPTLGANATVGNVTIDGGSVTVPDGVILSIAGSVTGAITTEDGSTIAFIGNNDQTLSDAATFDNITIAQTASGKKVIAPNGITVNGLATFETGVVSGDVSFSGSASATEASLTSYIEGTVTKTLGSAAFTFPLGSNGVLGEVDIPAIRSGGTVSMRFNKSVSEGGFDVENNGYPRFWNINDMCTEDGTNRFHHVSNVEYWDISSTAAVPGVNFRSIATSDIHFNDTSINQRDVEAIKFAIYDGCWKNMGGTASVSSNYHELTISGVNIPVTNQRTGLKGSFGSTDDATLLPIELLSFSATCNGKYAELEWSTATERNNDYFVIERSDDAINFTEVGRVAGAGNSIEQLDYTYNDYGIHGGDNYYRLVQVDYDGTRTVSEIVVATCEDAELGEPDVQAYPNPFNGELTLVLDNFDNRPATIEVYDMLGKLIYIQKADAPQNSYETILNLSNLPPAAYTVRVSTADFVINKQVVKN